MPFGGLGIAALGVATSAVGIGVAVIGQQKAAAAQQQIASQNQLQMTLDAARQRRAIARQAVMARSVSLTNATNQGAGFGPTSGLAGGQAAITAQAGSATLASNQNTQIGNTIFGLQRNVFSDESMADLGQGMSAFGNLMASNSTMLSKAGSYAYSSLFNSNSWNLDTGTSPG